MSEVPSELKYTTSHEWVRVEDSEAVIGITDHAQAQLGDLVFVEVPDIDANVEAKAEVAVVESVKAAADVYAPISGQVIAVNEKLANNPELVNSDPYHDGWLFRVKISDPEEVLTLMNAGTYNEQIQAED